MCPAAHFTTEQALGCTTFSVAQLITTHWGSTCTVAWNLFESVVLMFLIILVYKCNIQCFCGSILEIFFITLLFIKNRSNHVFFIFVCIFAIYYIPEVVIITRYVYNGFYMYVIWYTWSDMLFCLPYITMMW